MEMGSALYAIAFKTGVLLSIVAFASRILASRSAACRHLLWSIALVLSLLLPLASLILPSVLTVAVPSYLPVAAIGVPATATVDSLNPGSMLGAFWLCGMVVLLVRQARTHAGMLRWSRGARPVSGTPWLATLASLPSSRGVARSLRVLETARVSTPCTWGAVRPVLLLPASGADWSEDERRHALLHELAHVRRLDYVTGLIARLACAVHWYNPLVWLAARQVQLLQEQACDDAVLRGGEIPSRYAQLLVDLARSSPFAASPPGFAMSMARRSFLHGRVVAILDSHRARRPLQAFEAVSIGLLSCGLMLLLATSTFVRAQPIPSPEPVARLRAMAAMPGEPGEPGEPAVPAVLAVLAVPAVPTVPAVPAVPALPAIEADLTVPAIEARERVLDDLPPDATSGP